ncbi:MAG: hypothetical protein ACRCW2_13560 [Cellulosilyticaceae bacterium]
MNKFVPRCSRRTLFLLAALVWMMAGSMVMKFGLEVVLKDHGNKIIPVIVAIGVFMIFYNMIFRKMAHKHQHRILAKAQEKLCAFSFFDKKGYTIMALMMTMGITIRSLSFINPMYWAPFYIGLGTALFAAGVIFAVGWMRFNKMSALS